MISGKSLSSGVSQKHQMKLGTQDFMDYVCRVLYICSLGLKQT